MSDDSHQPQRLTSPLLLWPDSGTVFDALMQFPPPLRNALPWLLAASCSFGCANMLDYDAISFEEDPGSYNGVSASMECGTMPVPSLACAECVNTACCAEADVCGSNLACGALAVCRMACAQDDVACLHDCGIDYFDGIDDWKALNACADASCSDTC